METFLDEDTEIPSQKYAIVSFINPEKILVKKDNWFFAKFRSQYVIDTRMECWLKFCEFLSKKHGIVIDDIMKDFNEFRTIHEKSPDVSYSDIQEKWEIFLMKHEKLLEEQFSKENHYQTNIRSFKIRRVGDVLPEIQARARKFAELDGNKFNTAIVGVGKWCPFAPNEHMLENSEYVDDEMAKLLVQNDKDVEMRKKLLKEDTEHRSKQIREEQQKQKEQNDMMRQLENK